MGACTTHLNAQHDLTTTTQATHQQWLLLWLDAMLGVRTHPSAPARHPQYTGAHHGVEAVDWPKTTARTQREQQNTVMHISGWHRSRWLDEPSSPTGDDPRTDHHAGTCTICVTTNTMTARERETKRLVCPSASPCRMRSGT